jgi:hypothetical protein
MAQFGLKMDFLWLIQVSRFVFVLKMNFYNYFSVFKHLWTGRQLSESAGVIIQLFPRLRETGPRTASWFLVSTGALMQEWLGEGVRADPSRWIYFQRMGLDLEWNKPVRVYSRWIRDLWSGFNEARSSLSLGMADLRCLLIARTGKGIPNLGRPRPIRRPWFPRAKRYEEI